MSITRHRAQWETQLKEDDEKRINIDYITYREFHIYTTFFCFIIVILIILIISHILLRNCVQEQQSKMHKNTVLNWAYGLCIKIMFSVKQDAKRIRIKWIDKTDFFD